MALRGHVFSKQLFANECFALFIDTFLGGHNGIVEGCEVTNTTSKVSLASGYFCIQGRFLQEVGGSDFDVSSSETTLYQQLICEIDLSKVNQTGVLNQAYYKVLSSDEGYQTLIQQDISIPTQIYQFEFARWEVGSSGITNFQDTREALDFDSIYTEVRTTFNNLIAQISQEETQFFYELDLQAQTDYASYKDALDNLESLFEGYIDGLKDDAEEQLQAALNELTDEVNDWFDTIKGQISQDLGVQLQLEINAINDNKVTSISSASTDAQYPSAKCVYDAIEEVREIATKALDFKGQVNTYADLPSTGQEEGDLYQILTADSGHNINAGDFVVWEITNNVGAWLNLGSFIDVNALTDIAISVTLDKDDWTLNANNVYEQTIAMQGLTTAYFIDCALDFENQDILGASYPESFANSWKIYAKEEPADDVVMNVKFTRTRGGSV